MSGFRQAITGARFTGAGSFGVTGKYVESGSAAISFTASIQPASPKEMLTLPEGRRDGETYRLYTSFELKTADEVSKVNADRVTISGRTFEVLWVGIWKNDVIPHYKALVSLINV